MLPACRRFRTQLAKTLQLQRAAGTSTGSQRRTGFGHRWRSTSSGADGSPIYRNAFGREQHACDMRGRCWRGCDHQAKNTLDLNYLARAEDGDAAAGHPHAGGGHRDRARRRTDVHRPLQRSAAPRLGRIGAPRSTRAVGSRRSYVFLCAGSLNTTELLLRNRNTLLPKAAWTPPSDRTTFRTPTRWRWCSTATSRTRPTTDRRSRRRCSIDRASRRTFPAARWTSTAAGGRQRHAAGRRRADAAASPARRRSCRMRRFWTGAAGRQVRPARWCSARSRANSEPGNPWSSTVMRTATARSGRHCSRALVPGAGRRLSAGPGAARRDVPESPVAAPEPVSRVSTPPGRVETGPERRAPADASLSEGAGRGARRHGRGAGSSPGLVGGAFAIRPDGRRAAGRVLQQFAISFRDGSSRRSSSDREELFEQAAAFALPMVGRLLDELSATVDHTIGCRYALAPRRRPGRRTSTTTRRRCWFAGCCGRASRSWPAAKRRWRRRPPSCCSSRVPGTPPAAARSARRPAALGARLRHVRSVYRRCSSRWAATDYRGRLDLEPTPRALPTAAQSRRCPSRLPGHVGRDAGARACATSRARPGTASCAPIPPGPRSESGSRCTARAAVRWARPDRA